MSQNARHLDASGSKRHRNIKVTFAFFVLLCSQDILFPDRGNIAALGKGQEKKTNAYLLPLY